LDKDVLFLIGAPFEDEGAVWFCRDCVTMEGALALNPDWRANIDVRRLAYPRPRADVIALIGEENQSLPALVLADAGRAPPEAKRAGERAFITDVKAMLRYLHAQYGGVGPHP
jgi:hypothetical protein